MYMYNCLRVFAYFKGSLSVTITDWGCKVNMVVHIGTDCLLIFLSRIFVTKCKSIYLRVFEFFKKGLIVTPAI